MNYSDELKHQGRIEAVRKTFPALQIDADKIFMRCTVFLSGKDPRRADIYMIRGGKWYKAEFYFSKEFVNKIKPSPDPHKGLHILELTWPEFDTFSGSTELVSDIPGEHQVLSYGHWLSKDRFKVPVKPEGIKSTQYDLVQGMQIYQVRYLASSVTL
jgi:hypothetical protein